MTNNLPSNKETIKVLLEKNKEALKESLPRCLNPTKLIRIIITQLTQNPKLQECTQNSLICAILKSALYGLEPDGINAALVPFKNRKRGITECVFIPMYRGELKLARRTGEIALIYAEIVREGDEFKIIRGTNPELKHEPTLESDGNVLGAYAVYRLVSGETDFVWMNIAQLNKIKQRSRAANDGPWITDTEEMYKKTVLKRLLKYAPSSVEEYDAIEKDDSILNTINTLELPSPEEEVEGSIAEPQPLKPEEIHPPAEGSDNE